MRKVVSVVETVSIEMGRAVDGLHRKVATAVVLTNPLAGQWVDDLRELEALGAALGARLVDEALAALGAPAATWATSPGMSLCAMAADGAQPRLSPGMQRRSAATLSATAGLAMNGPTPASEQYATVTPGSGLNVGAPAAPRSVAYAVTDQPAAVPRALVTVIVCSAPVDTCSWPFNTTGDMTMTPGTLSMVIVVPTTGCTTISVRLQLALVASHWLASTVMLMLASALVSAVASVALNAMTTGAPGSVAGAA